MNSLPNLQNVPCLVWDGAAMTPLDIRRFARFGFTVKVKADLAADLVLEIQCADPSEEDSCVPGEFVPIPEVAMCDSGMTAEETTVTIPAGTVAGTVCHFTLPCKAGAFITFVAKSGPAADVCILAVLQGPSC